MTTTRVLNYYMEKSNMDTFIINGKKCLDKKTTFSYLKEILHLPEYFGNNLDALSDCLHESFQNKTIIILNKEIIVNYLSSYGEILLQVFEESGANIIYSA